METEQQLLNAIHSGDRQSMRRLYERFSGYAMAISLRYVPNRDEAQDVVQDSFVKILTSIGHFDYRGEGSLKGWVARVVVNHAIDYLKKNQRLIYENDLVDMPDDDEPAVEEVPPDILTAMIGRLPVGCRMVLNLYVFEQCTHKEIARRLGIKEDSSASQYSRAKKMLAKMVKEYIKHASR
ncbi:MAG: RNA polymerase sigma factor [Prevotella sp.]|nr:RNA polymerase sigma factor [Prevotella sp.]